MSSPSLLPDPSTHTPLPKENIAGVNLNAIEVGAPRPLEVLVAQNDKLDGKLKTAFGPFLCIEDARFALQTAEEYTFGVRLGTHHPGAFRRSSAHGARKTLHCSNHTCPYKVNLLVILIAE